VRLWINEEPRWFCALTPRPGTGRPSRSGNPTLYTTAIAERLLDEFADGRSLSDVCRDVGMPSRTAAWHRVKEVRDNFAARYRKAREFGCSMAQGTFCPHYG
jgi:hypothetical protein